VKLMWINIWVLRFIHLVKECFIPELNNGGPANWSLWGHRYLTLRWKIVSFRKFNFKFAITLDKFGASLCKSEHCKYWATRKRLRQKWRGFFLYLWWFQILEALKLLTQPTFRPLFWRRICQWTGLRLDEMKQQELLNEEYEVLYDALGAEIEVIDKFVWMN